MASKWKLWRGVVGFGMIIAAGVLVSACESVDVQPNPEAPENQKRESIFGEGGLTFGGERKRKEDSGAAGIGVNSFLWRATLDTISFMPINSADPFGGVIITDWHSPVETPDERFKMNIYILGRALRADGVRVSVFKQGKNAGGQWTEAPVGQNISTDIENAILTRARQLRNETIEQ